MQKTIQINNRPVGMNQPVYIIAEMSANHHHRYENAIQIIKAAKACGADAVKLQTYTADTMTIDCDTPSFKLKDTIWKGKTLYELYKEAATPWDWQPDLKSQADAIGIDLFSTPFDPSSVDFLDSMNVPVYKIASFEIVDFPLLKRVAQTRKPVILSTGMAGLDEIKEAVDLLHNNGCDDIILLKCTSAYPAPPEEANLLTIPDMFTRFGYPCGLSDHTMGSAVALGAVALGACVIEKHFTLSRNEPGPDSSFSMEPDEFKAMVDGIRTLEKALGKVSYDVTCKQKSSLVFRKSLFCVSDIQKGEVFTLDNVRSIRPGYGLHTRHLEEIIGKTAHQPISKGTPLTWDMID